MAKAEQLREELKVCNCCQDDHQFTLYKFVRLICKYSLPFCYQHRLFVICVYLESVHSVCLENGVDSTTFNMCDPEDLGYVTNQDHEPVCSRSPLDQVKQSTLMVQDL